MAGWMGGWMASWLTSWLTGWTDRQMDAGKTVTAGIVKEKRS